MTEITHETKKERIGSIYIDEWEGKKIRFHNYKKDQQYILLREKFAKMRRDKRWIVESKVTPSDSYEEVYEENINHLCSECEQEAMFDENKKEFYCPRCSE